MATSLQPEIETLRATITALEAQRVILGDVVVDTALASLREKLAALEAAAAAQAAPLEERRLITILFTDVVGSTSLVEKLDPEDWRQTVARLHSTVGRIIAERHGTVAQYLGDGLLAFFGGHESSEQDAENAVRAALDAQNAVAKLAVEPRLQIRVGLHTGLVVTGELGAESHKEFTATGDAVNLAARLQSAAPPGGILVSQDTYHYVRGVFDVTPQPPLTVKGKSEPLQTYLVRRAKPRAFRVAARGVSGIQTRTIGRDVELEQLRNAYLDAYENKRVVWVQLMGEPGVGKSRLMSDMDDWIELREETVRVLRGRAFAGEQNQPFALIRRMWFGRFQIADDTPRAQAEARWVERFREQTGILEEEPAHALGLLVGLTFEDSPYIGAMRNDPNQVKGRAFVVGRQALRAIRAERPVQMMLEDLQWADEASLEYLREVVLDTGGQTSDDGSLHGMFVLTSARPEWENVTANVMASRAAAKQSPSLDAEELAAGRPSTSSSLRSESAQGAPLAMTIGLAPLSDAATRELAQELLQKVENVPDDVVQMLVERAEGVPYFAEEMVNYFLDRGIIDRTVEPWQFVEGRLHESPLPATLQYLLRARLDTLALQERTALQRGAIFGRNFWAGGVQVLGVPQSANILGTLQPRGFVEQQPESSLEGESEWSFHHALLRDVTYESVLKRERAALHHKAAEWLEAQARQTGRLDEFAGLLGEHCEKAGELDAAARWFVRAGEHAAGQGATRPARDYFNRALALLPPTEQEQRWRALTGREAALTILGEREAHQSDLKALLALAEEMQDDGRRAEAWVRQAVAAGAAGDYRSSLPAGEQAIAAAERAGNEHVALLARSSQALALFRLGEAQAALQLAELVIAQARALGEDVNVSAALVDAASVLSESSDPARSVELHEEAMDAARRSGDRYNEAVLLGNLGYAYVQLGFYKQGRTTLEQALAVAEAIGARRKRAYNLQNLGLVYFRQGDGRAARRVLDESIREFAAVGDEFGRVSSLFYLALEHEHSGDLVGAARRFQQAADVFTKLVGHAYAQEARAGLGRCAFGQGQLEEARERVTELWNYLREQGTEAMEFPVWAYLTCADIFDALGVLEDSRAATEAGYRELMSRAEKIANLEWRKSFLDNVPEHREMVEMWERVKG